MNNSNENKTYSLQDLVKVNIDSWVEAMDHLDDIPEFKAEVLKEADKEDIERWKRMDECPAELEDYFSAIADRHNYRFDGDGNIVSYDK